jgi:hypothetical protein
VWSKGKFGFINHEGELQIPYRYASAGHFRDGLTAAKLTEKGKEGFIDKNGEWKIKPQFFVATDFEDGIALVCIGDTRKPHVRGLIDTEGKFIRKWKEE